MVPNDQRYVEMLVRKGIIRSPCLEAGAGLDGHNARPILHAAGIEWYGTDLHATTADVFVADLEQPFVDLQRALHGRRFQTILLLNVLEHVFEPIRVLDNACELLVDGGHCVVVTPTVWPLHYYPLDCWRINPGFYEEYCRRRGLRLLDEYFYYVTPGHPMDRDEARQCKLPPSTADKIKYWKSRLVHRVFDTVGRSMSFPSHVTTGAVIQVVRQA